MKDQTIILDLFAGYGGAELSFKYAGIKVDKSYISEVNPSAIKVLQKHYPDAIFVGDVRKLRAIDFIHVKYILGGSPCQFFSFAGRRKGMVTTTNEEIYTLERYLELKEEGFEFQGQSYLFWEFVRLYVEITKLQRKFGLPEAKFLLENVDMEQKWQDVISKALGVKPFVFDAAMVSAQSRVRLFWTNFFKKFELPKDKNIKIGDIIRGAVNGSGFRGRKVNGVYTYPQTIREDNKSNCLVTTLGSVVKSTGRMYGTGFYVTKNGTTKQLTVEQAEVLQGLEKGYTNVKGVSKTARIKMIGNGWSIPVTGHIMKQLKKEILKSEE